MNKHFKASIMASAFFTIVAAAQAGTYNYTVGSVVMNGTTDTNVTVNANLAATVRGWYITGDWHAVTASSQWSSENHTRITGTSGPITPYISSGGTSTSADATFGAVGTTWENHTNMIGDQVAGIDASGAITLGLGQSFGAAQQSTLSNTTLNLLTDAIPQMTATFSDSSPTFARPTSLTAVATTSTYHYASSVFSIANAGNYMVAANYLDAAGGPKDGYLLLYRGAFDSTSPLTNLIGDDDDGIVPSFGSSAMLLNLTAGDYTAVYTTFSSGTVGTGNVNVLASVAGGPQAVPEPMTMTVLGLGALALIRKRRSA